MPRVRLAALFQGYTGGRLDIEVSGATVAEVMASLDRRFPGLAFRVVDEQGKVRPHVSVFVGEERVTDPAAPVPPGAEVYLVGALSGG